MHDDHQHEEGHGESSNPWPDRINEAYYDAMGADFGRRTRDRINWMCAQAKGETALDVGCSQGITSILLAREGMRVTGIDIFEPAVSYANSERNKELASVRTRLTFICTDLADVRDQSFDTVILGEVVEHQTNPKKFISQAAGLVAKGGRLVLTVPFGLHPWPDHKSTIFPGDVVDALAQDFSVTLIDVEQGYIRLVAERHAQHAQERDAASLLRATERGALEVQSHFHEATAEHRDAAKNAQQTEKKLKEATDRASQLKEKLSALEKDQAEKLLKVSFMESSITEMRERLKALDTAQQERAKREERFADRAEALSGQLGKARAVSEQTSRSIIELESMRTRLERDGVVLKEENHKLEKRVADLEREHASASSELQARKLEVDRLSMLSSQLKREGERLQGELHEATEMGRSREGEFSTEKLGLERRIASSLRNEAELTLKLNELALKGDLLESQLRSANESAMTETASLKSRIANMSGELETAQHKRHGHFQHLKAERERSKKLIELLEGFHAENDIYRHSLALRLGQAILGARSLGGIVRLPKTLWGIGSSYRQRRAGLISKTELSIPEPEPVVLPPLNRMLAKHPPVVASPAMTKETVSRAVNELSAIGWRQEVPTEGLPVMSVLDEFSRACFAPQASLIEPRPDCWEALVDAYAPRFLLVESSWKGNHGSWQYRVSSYANPPGAELGEMAKGFRDRGLPTVFWNKEDPVHFDNFIAAAEHFDYVFTTAAEAVPRYQSRTKAKVGVLQFAAEESLHNPVGSAERNGKVCFAGSFYANRFADRRDDQLMLLDAASGFDLDIFDRNFTSNAGAKSDFAFPERFDRFVRGRLPYAAIGRAYREYSVFLNVNSVIDSPTMFSRRVFELLACGTPVVSTWSRGTEDTFGEDLVWHVRSREEAEDALRVLLGDADEWRRRSLQGIRAVLNRHTYRHRFNQICDAIGVPAGRVDPFADVLVVTEVESQDELSSVVESFRRQDLAHETKARLLALGRASIVSVDMRGTGDFIETSLPLHEVVRMARQTERSGMLAIMSPKAAYGRHYLQDLLNAARYSGSPLCGKADPGESAQEYLRNVALDASSLMVNTTLVGEDDLRRVLLQQATVIPGSIETYASDSANFLRVPKVLPQEDLAHLLKRVEI